ncbi:MAG: enoyl-CoA hydratase/isomerase family protein [Bacteroidota bacterium]|nr:enoyl-CoA hydratase/isomerase family protein [Bacteroidota bacterium]
MDAQGYVQSHNGHGITTIEFFHPKSNSLPGSLLNLLAQEIHYAGLHDSKVIILKSAGQGAFCAGASFDELLAIQTEKQGHDFFMGFANVINAMRKCNQLIIGRVQGKCVGGGVGLVAACDYAIALNSAEVRLSELSIGIGPFVVGPVLEKRMGISAFSHLAIDAAMWRSADWAKRKGLFSEIHETLQNLDESVYRLASALARSNPEAMKEMKKIFWQGTDHWDALLAQRASLSGKLVLSEFTRNAIAAFRKKD